MNLIDTHAHLHHEGLAGRVDDVVAAATVAGVTKIVNVGCNGADSVAALQLAEQHDGMWATVGLHPVDGEREGATDDIEQLRELATHPKVVAIGECGLDYARAGHHAEWQAKIFRAQIELALERDLPMVWHVRDAFDDFFEITGDYPGLRGIVHCYTSTQANLEKALERGFLIALNGIMTFTKIPAQLEVARAVPLESLVLETDCPFLTPVPHRGKTNEPLYLRDTAEYLAQLRGETLDQLAATTSRNAEKLLGI
jgi:TatD DNase family protein